MPSKSMRGNQSGVDSMAAPFSKYKGDKSKSVARAKPMKGSPKKGY